jgi:DNA-binding beta-propeller fold protein YncE
LQIVDLSTLKTVGTVALGEGTNPMQVALVGRKAYITLLLTNEVAEVDLDKLEVSQRIPVGNGPTGIAYANNKIYVTNTNFQGFDPSAGVSQYGPGTVSVLDPFTKQTLKNIPVDINPQTILEDNRGRLHVVCTGNFGDIPGKINVIDPKTDTVVSKIDIGGAPGSLAFVFNGKAYLSDSLNGLTSYDFRTLEILRPPSQALKVEPFPWAIVTDTRGNLYVSVLSTGELLILDTFKEEWLGRVGIGDCPEGLHLR